MPLIERRGHVLIQNLCPDPVWTNADATRMEEVFINLLDNAAKYTPEGGRIEVWAEHPHRANHVQFRVRDTGPGIDQELLPWIFDLFTQADRSLARSAGGLGIGLALAHRLVELHGGSIEVYSPPNGEIKGSEFVVRLPLVPPPLAPETIRPETRDAKPDGLRVLLVDDNIDSVMMLSILLREKGYHVEVAYTGPDGLKIAEQCRPDVVLLDIGLPGMDGYEVARRLRAKSKLDAAGAPMRLIAVTGYGRETDLALAREAGFDGHLIKPLEFSELEKMMTAPPHVVG
jgi:CheY-like chemotaxis protein